MNRPSPSARVPGPENQDKLPRDRVAQLERLPHAVLIQLVIDHEEKRDAARTAACQAEVDLHLKETQLAKSRADIQRGHNECARLETRLQQLCDLEESLRTARSDLERMRKRLVVTETQARNRESDFEAEKEAWAEERSNLQARIATLVESSRISKASDHANRHDHADETVVDSSDVHNSKKVTPQVPEELTQELTELRALVPAYVATVTSMENSLTELNAELEEMHHAYEELLKQNQSQQEALEQRAQLALEVDQPTYQPNLATELAQATAGPSMQCEQLADQSSRMASKRKRMSGPDRSTEIQELRDTNAKLNEYLERLLGRIVGLEAFEKVLHCDFDLNRERPRTRPICRTPYDHPPTPIAPSPAAASKALLQLRETKTKFWNKVMNSSSPAVRFLKPSTRPADRGPAQFISFPGPGSGPI